MTETEKRPLLSLIVPAYNEEKRLGTSLEQIVAFIDEQDFEAEVIVVNNNSSDATAEIADSFAAKYDYIRVLFEGTQGKGAAVKCGMLHGRGEYLFVCDADLSMPVEEVSKFLPPIMDGYDIAIASREMPGSKRVDEPEYRHLMGRVYNLIVRIMAIPRIQDTQCGFKSFRREVAHRVFPLQTINGWGFDVEVLFIALKHGYQLEEVPITWYYMTQSRVNPIKDSFNMFFELLKVRINGWRGFYRSDGGG